MKNIFLDPVEFFEQREPDLRVALGVVVVAGLASMLTSVLPMSHMTSQLAGQRADVMRISAIATGGITGFVSPFVLWVLIAGFGHVTSIFFEGTGEFRETLSYTAWAFLPLILSYLTVAGLRYTAVQQITPPSTMEGMRAASQQIPQLTAYRVAIALSIVFTLWSAFIWAVGVHKSRGITLREGAMSIAVPVLLYVGYQLLNIL